MSGVCVIIGNIYLIFVDVYFKKGVELYDFYKIYLYYVFQNID